MAQAEISKEEIAAIYPTVAATIADALGCDVDEVTPQASLIEDLNAESIDFLDIVFRLERAFESRFRAARSSRKRAGARARRFEQNSVVTDVGFAQLRAYLSEVPDARFKKPTKVKDIPRLFTAETFCKLVISAQHEAKPAA